MRSVFPRALDYDSADVSRPKASGYGAQIGDMWVRLAVGPERQLRYFTKDSLAQRQDTRGATSMNVLDIGYTWARTELDGGEGLDWDPRELSTDESAAARDVRRFWDSKNIDVSAPPAGEPYTISLTHQFAALAGHTAVQDLGASSVHVFIADGAIIYWYDDWADVTPESFTLTADVAMLAVSPGDDVMAIDVSGAAWYREPGQGAGTFVLLPADGGPAFLASWYVKGRFVAFRQTLGGSDGQLGELLEDGTFILFDTTGAHEVSSVVSAGAAIVACVSDGTVRSYVPEQANQTDPDSVNLVRRGVAQVPKGEIPSVLGASGDVLTMLTVTTDPDAPGVTTRFYRAEVLSSDYDYVVGGMQLQREWYGTSEVVDVRANMTPTRDSIWFAITEEGPETFIWRFDLTTFGLSRYAKVFDDTGYATVVFKGKGAVLNDVTNVAWVESDLYQPIGYMISPNITFGLNTDIAWISTVLEAFNLADTGAQVELWYSDKPEAILDWQDNSWRLVRRISNPEQSGDEFPLVGVKSRTLTMQLRIYSSGSYSVSPQVSRLAARGLPTHRDWIVHLPVNISDTVEVPGRMPQKIQGLGNQLHSEIMNMVGQSVTLTVLDPPLAFRGVVDNIEEPVTFVSERGSVSVYAMMEFRGARITATVPSVGDSGAGLGWLGVATMGVGQSIEPVEA